MRRPYCAKFIHWSFFFFSPENKKNSQAFQPQCYKHLINFLCNLKQTGEVVCWRGWFLTGGEDPARCVWLWRQLHMRWSRHSYCVWIDKIIGNQLMLLFLFLFTSSSCTSEKPCNKMSESFLALLDICFEMLTQIWAPDFFCDDLVLKSIVELLNTRFDEVPALIKQRHASVCLRVELVSAMAQGFFVYGAVILCLESEKYFCGPEAYTGTASMHGNRWGTCFCTLTVNLSGETK